MTTELIILALPLLAAAWRDLATRTIPDGFSIALAGLGLALRSLDGLQALGLSAATAALLFLALVLLHSRGALGGGDVKLAAALSLGLAPAATVDFLLATALAGGMLAVAYLALGRLSQAVADLTLAAAKLPDRPDVLYHLALAQAASHDKPAALRSAERALALAPDYAEARELSEQLRR